MPDPPRLDLDVLADLDAGLLDADRAAEVRAAALADPEAAAMLAALAATRAELTAAAAPQLPPEIAGRWAAALEAEAARADRDRAGADTRGTGLRHRLAEQDVDGPRPDGLSSSSADRTAPPPGPTRAAPAGGPRPPLGRPQSPLTRPHHSPPPGHRCRRASPRPPTHTGAERSGPPRLAGQWRSVLTRPAVVAAGLLAALMVVGVLWARPGPATDRVDLAGLGLAALGASDAGELADPGRRAGCLLAVAPPGVEPGAPLLGGRRVEVDDQPGVLLVLATGELGSFRIVVVDPACGPQGGTLLGSAVVGR